MKKNIQLLSYTLMIFIAVLCAGAWAGKLGYIGTIFKGIIHHRGGLQYINLLLSIHASVYTVMNYQKQRSRSFRHKQYAILGCAYGAALFSFGSGVLAVIRYAQNGRFSTIADVVRALYVVVDPILLCFICSSLCLIDIYRHRNIDREIAGLSFKE